MKRLVFSGLIILASLSYMGSAKADIYHHIDDNGVIHYTNYPQSIYNNSADYFKQGQSKYF